MALDVAARFLSLSSLFASVLARRSEVRSARAVYAGAAHEIASARATDAAFAFSSPIFATGEAALTARTAFAGLAGTPTRALEESASCETGGGQRKVGIDVSERERADRPPGRDEARGGRAIEAGGGVARVRGAPDETNATPAHLRGARVAAPGLAARSISSGHAPAR